jgi:glycosyltransferase involved in cell wall biosynthesis
MRSTSIVIPVFNRAHLVHRAIDSALGQTVPCEVVLVDHGSTDNIGELARRYGDRIRYVRREQDRGALASWRDGIEQATGELVHITYDDDWLQPTFVERCEPLLRSDVAFVYTSATVHDLDGNPVEVLNRHPEGIRPIGDIVNFLMRAPLGISPGCALFRRGDALRNLLPYVPRTDMEQGKSTGAGEDLLLFLLTSLDYPRYAHVAEPLADFLAHPGSITIGASLAGRIDTLAADYSAAKAYYLRQPGARRHVPLHKMLAQRRVRPGRPAINQRGGAIYFTPHFPWPPRHGAHHRILQTLRWAASRYGPVHLVVGRQSNDNGRSGVPPSELVSRLTMLDLEPSGPERLARHFRKPSVVDRTTWHSRSAFRRILEHDKPKAVFVNYVYWGRLLPGERDCVAIVDTHDVVCHTEHLLRRLAAVAQQDGDPFAHFEREPPLVDRLVQGQDQELRTLDAFDVVLAISRADEAFFKTALRRPKVVKLGYHPPPAEHWPPLRTFDRPRGLCPIGPNLFNAMGLRSLVREFDTLDGDRVYVTVTGARFPGAPQTAKPWCEFRGLVRDYARELATHQFGVMVPFTGTGAQIKQYEFAQAGLPIVGYRSRVDPDLYTNGVDALLVDRPEEMCRAIVRLADDDGYLAQVTAAARELPRRLDELRVRQESELETVLG